MTSTAIRFPRIAMLPIGMVAAAAVIFSSWAGLFQLGVVAAPPVPIHGPLMILGFLGTVISLERAVGLGQLWAWATPVLSALGTVLILTGRLQAGMVVMLVAGAVLVAVYLAAMRIAGYVDHLLVGGMGAVAWVVGAGAMAGKAATARVVPVLAVFLVLTIIGERLELSRMAPSRSQTRSWAVVAAALALLGFASVSVWWGAEGVRLAGVAMVVVAVLSAAGDIARRTIKMGGLTAFMAAAILAGYVWLTASGALWTSGGLVPATRLYDTALHTLFIGFVLSMIFAHAAVILPSVAGVQLPFHRSWWWALAALHLTLLVRVVGVILEIQGMKNIGGIGNVASIVLFVGLAVSSSVRSRRRS